MDHFKFTKGDEVFLRGRGWPWNNITPGIVRERFTHRCFPHYILDAPDGSTWQVPQLHLSAKPIVERK